MILFLTLVLLFLMITIGGERGAVSIMALAGNIIILFFSVILMSAGFPALLLILAAGAGVCYNSLFYQNGNNVKTQSCLSGYTVCNADSVYSDFCYYVENRKLWLK